MVKKKIISMLICSLFITIAFISTTTAVAITSNKKVNDNISMVNDGNPLTVRVEAKEAGHRVFEISVYVKNTWNKEIRVKSLYPSWVVYFQVYADENMDPLGWVYSSDQRWSRQWFFPIKFASGEEKKLLDLKWYGRCNNKLISNYHFLQKLPEGDYWIVGWMPRYTVNFKGDYNWTSSPPIVIHLPK
jgi:hypothetical protein